MSLETLPNVFIWHRACSLGPRGSKSGSRVRKELWMKKHPENRILGRRLAREVSREELEAAGAGPVATQTLRFPPDYDQLGGGPIEV